MEFVWLKTTNRDRKTASLVSWNRFYLGLLYPDCTVPDSAHVEMGYFNDFGQAEDSGCGYRFQLLIGNKHQGPDKLHDGITVQLFTADSNRESVKPLHSHPMVSLIFADG